MDQLDSSLYICDRQNLRVLRYVPGDSPTLNVWAGTGSFTERNEGFRLSLQLSGPEAIRKDMSGNVYLADVGSPSIIFIIAPNGNASYFIGSGGISASPLDVFPQPGNSVRIFDINYLTYDVSTNILFWGDTLGELPTPLVAQCDLSSEDSPCSIFFNTFAPSPALVNLQGIIPRPNSNQIWLSFPDRILSIPKSNPQTTSVIVGVSGNSSNTGDGLPIDSTTTINNPTAITFDSRSNAFILCPSGESMIRRINANGIN